MAPKWARHFTFALEVLSAAGMLMLWISFLILNIQIQQLAPKHPTDPRRVMAISTLQQTIFLTGDVCFVFTGIAMLIRLDGTTVSESMKLRWTCLFSGLVASIHLPIFIRSWIFRTSDAVTSVLESDDQGSIMLDSALESTQLMGAGVATAFCTAVCVVLTVTSLWGVDFFSSLRYSESLRRNSKLALIGALVAFESFFIVSLVEFQYHKSVISGIVLLCLCFILGVAGYLPARYYMIFQDELEEYIPFFATP